ncbi:MAG: RNA polymerase sigma factor [Cyclobacteriaceae bacterium]
MSVTGEHKEQFDALYSQYLPAVNQVCRGYMKGDEAVAADLCQEVFVNVWKALPTFRGDASPKTWIYRITVNTCLLYLRGHKKKREVALDAGHESLQDDTAKDDSHIKRLYRAIGSLQELDRLIIMMVLEEMAYPDIADVTGVSEDTLRVKIHRIKKRIKKHMETHPEHG